MVLEFVCRNLGSTGFEPRKVHTNAYPNAGCTMAKPLIRWYLRVVLMSLEGVLTVKLLVIVGAALTLALDRGRRC